MAGFSLPGTGTAQSVDPLANWGLRATRGAAAGYVDDTACAECHADKAESYAEMGMAKSFYRPSSAPVIENFALPPFHHAPSGRHYQMRRDGDGLIFRRWRQAPDGSVVDVFERRVDWILGSGHHVRTYLYQTADGALFELPLAWYAQGGYWEMNPGFEFENQQGVLRQVPRRCMVCHNALPEVPVGSDRVGMPDLFPHDLPQGLGCQRCHGPGAAHVRRAIAGEANTDLLRALIVNPGKLPRDRLYSICYGCHMQPTVAVNAPLRGGRGIYSFRPGQDGNAYLTHIDITDATRAEDARFEINHHPYRLEQSACFQQSGGQLGCLDCHDPHVKIKPEERAAHYRKACLSCHETDASGLPVQTSGRPHPAMSQTDDCTACHMPERRTQDVIHVTMTDHRISRDPGDLAELTAPVAKIPAEVTAVRLLREGVLSDDEKVIQQVLAIFSHTGRRADYAADALARVLERSDWPHAGPWLELAKSRQVLEYYDKALAAADAALARDPANPDALGTRALALIKLGRLDQALAALDRTLEIAPDFAKHRFNRAVTLLLMGQQEAALAEARRIVARRDNHWAAWRMIGEIGAARGDDAAAIAAYLEALAIEPRAPRVRDKLIGILKATGQPEEAARHGLPE
ncbi:tetratricopeptide repeat protein [Marimonas arenosa]|uniref:Tetratricopeptide repeat protein n=2 Tax=Marimonas arenosa TaxID=1795305 RepID=A0AAE3W905_9RHOB|nr:tetratricopeptide repeat protein [Marimonas arenosa]